MSQDQAQEVLESAVKNQPKKWGCRRGCLVTLLVLALPFWWFCIHTTPLRISKETTYALGPMMSDGKRIDYFRAMEERYYPPEMQTDDNGYRLLVRACGVMVKFKNFDAEPQEFRYTEDAPEPLRIQMYEKLGLDPDEKPTLNLEQIVLSPSKYIENLIPPQADQEEEIRLYEMDNDIMSKPWTLKKYPIMEEWIEQVGPFADLLGEVARKPAFQIPLVRENENMVFNEAFNLTSPYMMMIDWGRILPARIQYRIGIGDIDGAIDDIVTMCRLARHVEKKSLISYFIGGFFELKACSIGIGGNPDVPPTKEQIERLLAEINALSPRTTLGEAFEYDRYGNLGEIQEIYWGNIPDYYENWAKPLIYAISKTVDVNLFMTSTNKHYDDLRNGVFDSVRKPSWNPLPFLFVKSRTKKIHAGLAWRVGYAISEHYESKCQAQECAANMQRLTLALLLYEKEHGQLSDGDWREAVRPYLGENPDKYFRCPSSNLTENESVYFLIQREPDSDRPPITPGTPLLIEISPAIQKQLGDKLKNGTVSEELVTSFEALGFAHPGTGCSISFYSGAVGHFYPTPDNEETVKALTGGR